MGTGLQEAGTGTQLSAPAMELSLNSSVRSLGVSHTPVSEQVQDRELCSVPGVRRPGEYISDHSPQGGRYSPCTRVPGRCLQTRGEMPLAENRERLSITEGGAGLGSRGREDSMGMLAEGSLPGV